MKHLLFAIIVVLLPTFVTLGQEKIANPELARFIDGLAAEDQRPYERLKKNEITAEQAEKDFKTVTANNVVHLKRIIKKYGYPSHKLVGKTSSHHFWMMVQHSDSDRAFQKKVLKLMLKKVKKNEASGQDYAFLVDRVRVNANQPQLYGTQIVVNDVKNGYELKPVFQPEELNERRKEIGLPPIEEYLEKANKLFFELNREKLSKP